VGNSHARSVGVLILPLPFHQPLTADRVSALRSWVERGGGLFFLGNYAADVHHGTNPSSLTRAWGIHFDQNVLLPAGITNCDRGHAYGWADTFAVHVKVPSATSHPIVAEVSQFDMVSSASL